MKNNKGLADIAILTYVVVGLIVLFVPNPVSSALGVGIRPNKTVQTQSTLEKVDFLKRDLLGRPVAEADGAYLTKTTISQAANDKDIQQKVSIWEQLRSLPILYLILMGLGGFFPVVAGVMAKFNATVKKRWQSVMNEKESLKSDTTKIIKGMDKAFSRIAPVLASARLPGEIDVAALADKIEDEMKWELGDYYNDSTKKLVREVRGGKEEA